VEEELLLYSTTGNSNDCGTTLRGSMSQFYLTFVERVEEELPLYSTTGNSNYFETTLRGSMSQFYLTFVERVEEETAPFLQNR
jgi:hypothetical protein